jgi:carboxypeptidase Taq
MSQNYALNYRKLEQEFEQIIHLQNILSLAQWDASVGLPAGAAENRNREMATVSSLIHDRISAHDIAILLEAASDEEPMLSDWQKANLKNMKRWHKNATCISKEMEYENSLLSSECEFVWRSARENNDFKKLEPYLDKVFESARKIADLRSGAFGKKPYDALIDLYDEGRTSSEIRVVYDLLKVELPKLIEKIVQKQSSEKVIPLKQKIDEKTQREMGFKIIQRMGFDINHGRLDKSTHPFCSGSNDDVRLTTRYDENNFITGIFGIIHEAGHGLYQQNLPKQYRDQPVGSPKGMAFHESQSLIMEMQACTSKSFAEFLASFLRDEFAIKGEEYSAENLYKLVTRVKPGFIRVDADEVTYPLHVILRFEIELEIIENNLKAKDLPGLWNDKMKQYLGVVPESDKNGCMQDIHWPSGAFGYFPSYSNGAIIASMLMKKAKDQFPEIDQQLSEGRFDSLNSYLNENFRSLGSSKSSGDLLLHATGYPEINPSIFLDYLKNKFL